MTDFTLQTLETMIAERANADPATSWTAKLVAGGMEKAGKKFGEEATETLIAALAQDNAALASESADLIYHWMVMLHIRGVSLDDVLARLQARSGQSGIAEKAARQAK